jgi:hypothetical protein
MEVSWMKQRARVEERLRVVMWASVRGEKDCGAGAPNCLSGTMEEAHPIPETGRRSRREKALTVLRVLVAMAIVPATFIAALISAASLVYNNDLVMTVLADVLGADPGDLPPQVAFAVAALLAMAPAALLAGALARPYWWLPALPLLLLGCVAWVMTVASGYATGEDFQMLLVAHVGGVGTAALLGFLGSRVVQRAGPGGAIVCLGTVWAAAIITLGSNAADIDYDPRVAAWLLLVGVQVGLVVVSLAAYWSPDAMGRTLLGIGSAVWLLAVAATVGVFSHFRLVGELHWYAPLLWMAVGCALIAALGMLAAASELWRVGVRSGLPRVAFALMCLAAVGTFVMVQRQIATSGRGEQLPTYARLSISPAVDLYVQISGGEIRIARSPEGLDSAQPIGSSDGGYPFVEFPETDLPLRAAELPAGCKRLRAKFQLLQHGGALWGRRREVPDSMCQIALGYVYEDGDGSQWAYWVGSNWVIPTTSLEATEVVTAPPLADLRTEVAAQVGRGGEDQVGLAIVVEAGEQGLDDVQKDGESVQASLEVMDSGGSVVASTKGTLDDLGFT